ncbi:MAG: cation-transporting P-type ATPase, partial [Chloroflexota bacterium]
MSARDSAGARTPASGTAAAPAWHALAVADVERELATSPVGLRAEEVAARRARHGPNALPEPPPTSPLALVLHQFRSPLIYILLIATAITIVLGEYLDASVIAVVLAVNAVVGFFQERRAERSVQALMRLLAPHARAIREGREVDLESRELVAGDVVLVESGARVPADLRLFGATALRADESLLTGESLPVTKTADPVDPRAGAADRTCLLYAGTIVASGRGRGYVVATGPRTTLGAITEQVRGEARLETPLQQRVARFGRIVAVVVR